MGTLDLSDAHGLPLLTGEDCAERLWSLNAAVLGTDLYAGGDATFARIDVQKSNSFFSQWCSPPSSDDLFQVASIRPTRNLFREPGYGGDVTPELAEDPGELFGRARIEAYFNVERAEFESDEYESGATAELAARGLYGNYALFIPASSISDGQSAGLVLDNVDDILLRLDYVSVAQ